MANYLSAQKFPRSPTSTAPAGCTPGEALDCFLRTQMDVLVMGDIMLSRRQAAAS